MIVSSLHYLCHMKKLKDMKQKINQSGVILGGEPLSAKFTLQAPRVNPIVSIYIFTSRYKYSNILYIR